MGDSGMIRFSRMLRAGALTDLILISVFVTLAFVFVQRRGYINSVTPRDLANHPQGAYKVAEHARENTDQQEPQGTIADITALIDDRIRQIADVRSKKCRKLSYDINDLQVALIIHFFDYEFFDLKTTMSSIVHHTSMELIKEIIIVDDGSTLEYIKEDAKAFVEKFPMAKMLRLEDRQGASYARTHALNKVEAPIAVFLDTNVIVSEGWLEPLISLLKHEPNTIAIPHYDNINDPVSYEYVTTDDKLATIFSWSFTVRMFMHPDIAKDAATVQTPVMRGNALAARTKFIKKLGGFDRGINDPAGEILEFSFRTWLCGGMLKIATCSRVGILTLNEPIAITSKDTVRRITELWLPKRSDYVYKSIGVTKNMASSEKEGINGRKRELKHLHCKSFDWYLSNVAKNVFTPSDKALYYGLLKCHTGSCVKVANDSRLELVGCRATSFTHPPEMLFEFTKSGTLMVNGKCIFIKDSAYAVAVDCKPNDVRQQFLYEGNQLINTWSHYCLMHVTDPDKKVAKGRQIAMAQECALDTTGEFVQWDFLNT